MLELAVKCQTLVVEDDPMATCTLARRRRQASMRWSDTVPGGRELLAHCGSMSKVLSPGLRGLDDCAARLLARATMQTVQRRARSTFAQTTAGTLKGRPHAPPRWTKVRKVYGERARVMGDALRRELGNAIEFVQPGRPVCVSAP